MEEQPRARRRWGSLTRETVIDGALELVDGEGLEALTMPRLARHLGTGVMTLYGHVANKADLVDALAERVLSELEVVDGQRPDWDGALASHMRCLRRVILRHPALGAVLATRRVATPSVFRDQEASLGLLRSAGFDRPTAVQIYFACSPTHSASSPGRSRGRTTSPQPTMASSGTTSSPTSRPASTPPCTTWLSSFRTPRASVSSRQASARCCAVSRRASSSSPMRRGRRSRSLLPQPRRRRRASSQ